MIIVSAKWTAPTVYSYKVDLDQDREVCFEVSSSGQCRIGMLNGTVRSELAFSPEAALALFYLMQDAQEKFAPEFA